MKKVKVNGITITVTEEKYKAIEAFVADLFKRHGKAMSILANS